MTLDHIHLENIYTCIMDTHACTHTCSQTCGLLKVYRQSVLWFMLELCDAGDSAPGIHFIIYKFSHDRHFEFGTGYNLFLCLLKNWNFSELFMCDVVVSTEVFSEVCSYTVCAPLLSAWKFHPTRFFIYAILLFTIISVKTMMVFQVGSIALWC